MRQSSASFCFIAMFILFDQGVCECCDYFDHFSCELFFFYYKCDVQMHFAGSFGPTINISLTGSANLRLRSYDIGSYICDNFEVFWKIVRADGETEVYTVANNDEYHYGRRETLYDRGLTFSGYCDFPCHPRLTVTPTDLRYNGAQITGVVDLPECFNTSNTTNTTILRIQG